MYLESKKREINICSLCSYIYIYQYVPKLVKNVKQRDWRHD